MLSRHAVWDLGLLQTAQYSDKQDAKMGVLNDIYFNTVDIHSKNKVCFYGPVVFEFDLAALEDMPEGSIRVTKKNVVHWSSSDSESDRYFLDAQEMQQNYLKGNIGQHIIVHNYSGLFGFSHLTKLEIKQPLFTTVKTNKIRYFENTPEVTYSDGVYYLEELIKNKGYPFKLEKKVCGPACNCSDYYKEKDYVFKKHYSQNAPYSDSPNGLG